MSVYCKSIPACLSCFTQTAQHPHVGDLNTLPSKFAAMTSGVLRVCKAIMPPSIKVAAFLRDIECKANLPKYLRLSRSRLTFLPAFLHPISDLHLKLVEKVGTHRFPIGKLLCSKMNMLSAKLLHSVLKAIIN